MRRKSPLLTGKAQRLEMGLHLLDAPGRLARFRRKHPELAGRIPKKELAAYLNLTPETLSRLAQKLGRVKAAM